MKNETWRVHLIKLLGLIIVLTGSFFLFKFYSKNTSFENFSSFAMVFVGVMCLFYNPSYFIYKPSRNRPSLLLSMFFGLLILMLARDSYKKTTIVDKKDPYKITLSPKGDYLIRFRSTSEIELVTPKKPEIILSDPAYDPSTVVDVSNFTWNYNEEILAVTYVTSSKGKKSAILQFINSGDASIIKTIDLGTAGYYGVNKDQAFAPKVSPDGKYIAIQSDLIHSFSIYDWKGNLITKQPTVYTSTKLFSNEMYELDGGRYSPFLQYEWSKDGKYLIYNFQKSTENEGIVSHKLDLTKYLQ